MKKYWLFFCFVSVLCLTACTNDIVRERVIEIDDKYDVLCAQGPVDEQIGVGKEVCIKDQEVIAEFKSIINGIDAKKFTMASDLVEFTKEIDQNGRYMFGLFQSDKPNGVAYYVTAYQNGIFQFPEISTTEMRYVSKKEYVDKFVAIEAFVAEHFKNN